MPCDLAMVTALASGGDRAETMSSLPAPARGPLGESEVYRPTTPFPEAARLTSKGFR